MAVVNILFVCSGNTCRSPMASAIFKQAIKENGLENKFKCKSVGVSAIEGQDMAENAKSALMQLGINYKAHKSKQFNLQLIKKNKYVITMTADIKNKICSSCFGAFNVYSLSEMVDGEDIPDPYGGSLEDYLYVAKYLKYLIDKLVDRFIKEFGV